jgi:tetratricopeptide (TPR) repeat protein
MGGVGKTALARFCAAQAVERGWFPGGAYLVDLMVSGDALYAPLPHQFGVERVLLILDNASTAAQVEGLLPTTGDHQVLVTTRDTLAIPGTRRLSLDILTEADALALLDEALREHDPADDRATNGAELVGRCGLLPLAIHLAAGLLVGEPHTTCAELATRLASTHEETPVALALATSIDRLADQDPRAAQLVRVLPLNPGPDFATEAAAALGGMSVVAAHAALRVLRQAHLVTNVGTRWRLPDLIRRHLLDRLEERAAASTRLLDHYTTIAQTADAHLRALPGKPVPDLFTGRDHALAWFDTEHANLVAAVQWAAATNHAWHTARLAMALNEYLEWRRHFHDWRTVSHTAVDACHRSGDRLGEASSWNNLGLALRYLKQFDEAAIAHRHDLAFCQQTGDRSGEGMAWDNLGLVLRYLKQFDDSAAAHEHALTIFRETDDRQREGMAWNNLGTTLGEQRRFDEALTAHQHALAILRETGDRHREGMVWENVGLVFQDLHRIDEARHCWREAIAAYTETSDADSARYLLTLLGDEDPTGS